MSSVRTVPRDGVASNFLGIRLVGSGGLRLRCGLGRGLGPASHFDVARGERPVGVKFEICQTYRRIFSSVAPINRYTKSWDPHICLAEIPLGHNQKTLSPRTQ